MTQYASGADALVALNASNDGGSSDNSFASFKSGTTYKVRVMSTADLITYYGYSIFKEINTFVAKLPSELNKKGFPESNLTPWDKAADYYAKLMFDEKDEDKKKEYKESAGRYRGSQRFALGFIDLDTGTPIIIDLSKKQAKAVHAVIMKQAAKLEKKAFELEKTGSKSDTVVTLSVLDIDDLSEKQQAKFAEWDGKEFDKSKFEGILYEQDEAQMVTLLRQAGFDVSLIGYSASPDASETSDTIPEEDENNLPF